MLTEQKDASLESLYRKKLETALATAKAELAAASQEFDETQDEMNEILGILSNQGRVLEVGEKAELAQYSGIQVIAKSYQT